MCDCCDVALYRKIVSYILLQSGLGSPTDIAVVREATGKFVYIKWIPINTTLLLQQKLMCLLCIYFMHSVTLYDVAYFMHSCSSECISSN